MTDTERITMLEERMAAQDMSNKLLSRDNKVLARQIKRLEEMVTDLSAVEAPTLKGFRFKNLPNGDQEIQPIL